MTLGGGCFVVGAQVRNVELRETKMPEQGAGWICDYENVDAAPVEVGVFARCLNPAL